MERCTNCQYYDRNKGVAEGKTGAAGLCRRAAPALSPINQKSYMIEGVWPTVRDDDWCGEWKTPGRRADPARLTEVLGTGPGTPFPGGPTGPRLPFTGPRPAFGPPPSVERSRPVAALPGLPTEVRADD